MAAISWTLLDTTTETYACPLEISPPAGTAPGYRVTSRTLRGGLSDGVQVVRVDNGRLAFDVLPTRGMGLWKAWLDGQEIGWRSPVRGPVHPKFVPLTEPGGLGWLDGFDELLVRCGLESNGAPEFDPQNRLVYPLHGRIANKPAHRVEVAIDEDAGEIRLTGVVEETRFHFTKLRLTTTITTKLGEPRLSITDQVENFSGSAAEAQLLYHINFGQPLLDPGSRLVAAVRKVVPRDARAAEGIATWNEYAPPLPDYAEQVYLMELLDREDGWTRTLLKNAEGNRGVGVHLNAAELPCFTLWKNTITESDGYTTGLEPGTNFPNPRTFEGQQGRVVKLPPGGTETFQLGLVLLTNSDEVAQEEAEIAQLQGDVQPQICGQPQPDWCAG